MFTLMIVVFVIGYACIALEHPLRVNKSATALILGTLMWVLLAVGDPSGFPVFTSFQDFVSTQPDATFVSWLTGGQLISHLGEVAEILFFLIGAMTIVEIVDAHDGFSIITNRINTTKKIPLLWTMSVITFFLSAILDNLTTSIIMVALLRKLLHKKEDRWFFAGMVILAANAGGAWSPIGDVTTIMLWIGGKISAGSIVVQTILPSIVSLVVPLTILTFTMKGKVDQSKTDQDNNSHTTVFVSKKQEYIVLFLGVGILISVPIFKAVTHLPPYLGMLGGLGILWMITELMHRSRSEKEMSVLGVAGALKRIEIPSILFFLGILMAVAALQTAGHLGMLSASLENIPLEEPSKYYLITTIIGFFSSIVDNVPLVAGSMGMYTFHIDHYFWSFLAYAAGTGGSILIIGSAAGVAVMGLEKIDFIWYLKKISLLALVGYLAGCITFIIQHSLFVY